jgi:hypothetical protein
MKKIFDRKRRGKDRTPLPGEGESEARGLDAEGPDKRWLDAESERRREKFEQHRAQERIARMAVREAQALSRRLSAVEKAILTASTVSSPADGARGGKPDSRRPPHADMMEVGGAEPEEARRLLRIVRDAVQKLEALVDEQQYGGASRPEAFGSDLDELLRTQYRGYSPEDVSLLEPSLGSPAAVRKSRQNMKPPLHRETGEILPPEKRRKTL